MSVLGIPGGHAVVILALIAGIVASPTGCKGGEDGVSSYDARAIYDVQILDANGKVIAKVDAVPYVRWQVYGDELILRGDTAMPGHYAYWSLTKRPRTGP